MKRKNKTFLKIKECLLTCLILIVPILALPAPLYANEDEEYYDCVGKALADYMNALCAAKGSFPKIKLLSPAFNVSSFTFPGIVGGMNDNGANWACLDGIAGNLYNDHTTITSHINDVETAFGGIGVSKPLFITETGWFNYYSNSVPKETAKEQLKQELSSNSGRYSAALLFNAFGTGYGWGKFVMTDEEISFVCDGSCGKLGPNSAAVFKQSDTFYDRAQSNGMGYTLEIAGASLLPETVGGVNAALSRGETPIIRIGVSGTGLGFESVDTYINFLQNLNSQISGTAYALAGPNEPDLEPWLTPNCTQLTPIGACGYPKTDMETVKYETQVIGFNGQYGAEFIDGEAPWIIKASRDLTNQANKPDFNERFKVTMTNQYPTPRIQPIARREAGNPAEVNARLNLPVPSLPPLIAFRVPTTFIAASFKEPARPVTVEGEMPNDFIQRVTGYTGNEVGKGETMQAGPTSQRARFKICIQALNAETGVAFPIEGNIDMSEPLDRHGVSVADNHISRLFCPPGTPCQSKLDRFNDGGYSMTPTELAEKYPDTNIFISEETSVTKEETADSKEIQNKTDPISAIKDIFNPKYSEAYQCNADIPVVQLETWTEQAVSPTGIFDVGYTIRTHNGGACNLRDLNISMNGTWVYGLGGSTVFDLSWGAGDGGLPGFPAQDLKNGLTLTACINGGREGDVQNGCHDESCFPQTQCVTCELTARLQGGVYVPESTCGFASAPGPQILDCRNCRDWAGSSCRPITDPIPYDKNECVEGECARIVDTENEINMWSCIEDCFDPCDPGDPNCTPSQQCVWNCLFGTKYTVRMKPADGYFTADYGRRTDDMFVNNTLVCIPGVSDELCEQKDSSDYAFVEFQPGTKNISLDTGQSPIRKTKIKYTFFHNDIKRFCQREQLLTSPVYGFPEGDYGEVQAMCNMIPGAVNNGGMVVVGGGTPMNGGGGGGIVLLQDDNKFDPDLGAVTSIYDGAGRGRDNPLVDSLMTNYAWADFQGAPNSINDYRVNQLKEWITANATSGKKSIFEINVMEDRPNEGFRWGPDFTENPEYDPIVFSDGAKLVNYDNQNVKNQFAYFVQRLGQEFNNDPRVEAVIITNERRPVNTPGTLPAGTTVTNNSGGQTPVDQRIDGYEVRWGDAYGSQWVNWNKFVTETYRNAFPNKILIGNIAGGPVGPRPQIVQDLLDKDISIKNSGHAADFGNRQADPVYGAYVNWIDAQRATMDQTLQMAEYGHYCEIPMPAFSDAWKHPPQALYWEILSLLSYGGDQIQYFSGTDNTNNMLDHNSIVVRSSIDYFRSYRNTTPSTTPSVWVALRGSEVGTPNNAAECPPEWWHPYDENYGWFMIQDDEPSDGKTLKWFTPWIPTQHIDAISFDRYYRSTDTASALDQDNNPTSGKMYFKLAPGFYSSGNNFVVKVRYKGTNADTFSLVYKNTLGEIITKGPYTKVGNNEWFEESIILEDANFANAFGANSFYIDSNGDGDEYIGFVDVSKQTN